MARTSIVSILVALGLCVAGPAGRALAAPGPGDASVCRPGQPGGRPGVCMDAFYEVLLPYGTWIDTDRYGLLFCPDPTRFEPDFRPFTRGHWVMTEAGWTFIGDHPVSWVTDHYGRWVEAKLQGCTWGWVPGEVWSPAWVEFHVGENVIAWRPAPFDGVPVMLRVPPGTALQRVELGPGAQAPSPHSFVAVPDGDFLAPQIAEVALRGPKLHGALQEVALLPDPQAGLHSQERVEVVARLYEARGLLPGPGLGAAPGALSGEPPEPAARVSRKGQGQGQGQAAGQAQGQVQRRPEVAGTVRADRKGKGPTEGRGRPSPGDNAPGTGKTYWPGDQNSGGFTRPGPTGGVKVLEWGKDEKKPLPPPRTPGQK